MFARAENTVRYYLLKFYKFNDWYLVMPVKNSRKPCVKSYIGEFQKKGEYANEKESFSCYIGKYNAGKYSSTGNGRDTECRNIGG